MKGKKKTNGSFLNSDVPGEDSGEQGPCAQGPVCADITMTSTACRVAQGTRSAAGLLSHCWEGRGGLYT